MGQIIKADIGDGEQEFEVLGKPTTFPIGEVATHVIGVDCKIREAGSGTYLCYLRLIRKQHTFGGVVFEETGERRKAQNEWVLNEAKVGVPGFAVIYIQGVSNVEFCILRHVCEAQP